MNGVIEIKYDNNENEVISKIFKINDKTVTEEEFFKKLNELNKIEIIHCYLPLYERGFGNSYGLGYILENLKRDNRYIYFSMYRFSNTWGVWSDVGLTGCKYDLYNVILKNDINLKELIDFLMKNPEWWEIEELIEQYSDEFLCEEDIIKEIAKEEYNITPDSEEFYDRYTEFIEKIEDYIKNKYHNKIINIITDEGEIYSIIT